VIDKALELSDPTENELKTEYPEWDEMTSVEKRNAKNNRSNNRKGLGEFIILTISRKSTVVYPAVFLFWM
jgi:hypothetical protein